MIDFDNTYSTLPESFYVEATPESVSNPVLLDFNREFASEGLGLNLDTTSDAELAALFTGQILPKSASPISLAYAGHQFGHFVPQLGDGRAHLIGEIVSPAGKRYDIQLKGSGQTPFSRRGDGKSALGPVVREYIVSEAMHFLGVPTTRALAAATTGDLVYREEPLPGAIFTRVASSHIRIGTFEYFAARHDPVSLRLLLDYSIDRHYPEIKDEENRSLCFLERVAHGHAAMVAHWLSLGFIHGVMNTDNMSISGETIDYGPCAFIDNFALDTVFSSIDRYGRYSYKNQIDIAIWNLSRLASCLVPLVHDDQKTAVSMLEEAINGYAHVYEEKRIEMMRRKLGLFGSHPEDESLIRDWLHYLEDGDRDFTLSFRKLGEAPEELVNNAFLTEFLLKWEKRRGNQAKDLQQSRDLMNSVNPVFIPRNHHVERAIQAAMEGDLSIFQDMNHFLRKPYVEQSKFESYKNPPKPHERIQATFCGT